MAAKKPSTKSKQRVKKPTKSGMLEEAADLLSRIEEAERRCTVAKLRIESRKEAYRNARNAYADCVEELRKLARARAENHPLFDQAEKQQQAQETQSVESKSVKGSAKRAARRYAALISLSGNHTRNTAETRKRLHSREN